MKETELAKRLCDGLRVPDRVEIHAIRSFTVDENRARLRRLLAVTGEACDRPFDRADWTRTEDRSVARLPRGGRAEVFHASGAMRIKTGLEPMQLLFDRVEPAKRLEKLVDGLAGRLRVRDWMAPHETLTFERLWQIKAAAADRRGKTVDPVLCRVIGAYRQSIAGLPVLGAASVAINVASGGVLDSLSVQTVESNPEPIDSAALIGPDEAARKVHLFLESMMGKSKAPRDKLKIDAQPLRLAYLLLGKRKAQRVVAPYYFAEVRIEHEEIQGYQLVVPATEKTHQQLCLSGNDPPATQYRRAA